MWLGVFVETKGGTTGADTETKLFNYRLSGFLRPLKKTPST